MPIALPPSSWWLALPLLSFILLGALEAWRPLRRGRPDAADWLLNGSGLLMQGAAIPLAALWLGAALAEWLPQWNGLLPGAATAFLLNFVALDLLYYLQHRWFHAGGWALHRAHHGARRLGAWTSARNSLAAHPLFVYFLPSALLALLCADKAAWLAGAMLTASLDLWRHSTVRWPAGWARAGRWAAALLVTPAVHHLHHAAGAPRCNFGANLTLWDRAFGSYRAPDGYPADYGVAAGQPAWAQLLLPWRQRDASRT